MTNMGMEIVSFSIRDIKTSRGTSRPWGSGERRKSSETPPSVKPRPRVIRGSRRPRRPAATGGEIQRRQRLSPSRNATSRAGKQSTPSRSTRDEPRPSWAYPLQEAKTRQRIREEELQVEVVERQKQIEVQPARDRASGARVGCDCPASGRSRARPAGAGRGGAQGAVPELKPKPNDTSSRRWPRVSAPVLLRRPRQRPRLPYYVEKPRRRPSRRVARLRGRPSGPRDSQRHRRWTRRPMRGSSTDRLP